jgi:hypothetical protein
MQNDPGVTSLPKHRAIWITSGTSSRMSKHILVLAIELLLLKRMPEDPFHKGLKG